MKSTISIAAASKHFLTVDRVMASRLEQTLTSSTPLAIPKASQPNEYFARIARSIIGQQISIHAAAAVAARVTALAGTITPTTIQGLSIEQLRDCGLSGQKIKYLQYNATNWHEVPTASFTDMDDEAIIAELTKLYGIGRWTAEMFLMFSLARRDVFSYGDLGLMNGLFLQYPSIKKHHVRKIRTLVDSWSPHRTVASLVLWHQKDNGPLLF